MNTLCSKSSRIFPWDKDLKTSLQQLPLVTAKTKTYTTYLLYNKSFHHCSVKFLSNAPHLAVPLPHHHLTSSNNTYIPNQRKDTKVSMLLNTNAYPFYNFPCLHVVERKNPQLPREKKTCFFEKTLKLFFVHIQNPKFRNLLHMWHLLPWFICVRINFKFSETPANHA
jgi:hypothetical protein